MFVEAPALWYSSVVTRNKKGDNSADMTTNQRAIPARSDMLILRDVPVLELLSEEDTDFVNSLFRSNATSSAPYADIAIGMPVWFWKLL